MQHKVTTVTHKQCRGIVYISTRASSSASSVASSLGCHIWISKYLTRGTMLYPERDTDKTATQYQIMNIMYILVINITYIMNSSAIMIIMHTHKNRSRLFYPVLAGSTSSKAINSITTLIMSWNTSIKATHWHIRQSIVNIGVVWMLQGKCFAVINAYGLVEPPGLGLEVDRSMQWTKTLKPGRKAAVSREK